MQLYRGTWPGGERGFWWSPSAAYASQYGGGLVYTALVPREAVLMMKRALFTHEFEFVVEVPGYTEVCEIK